jgi:hypothetical protein
MDATPGGSDSLTRTTMHVDGTLSLPLVAGVVHALQRVPGVLLADLDAGTARLTVAHDGAVPVASLIAAAARAGVTTRVLRTGVAPDPGVPQRAAAVARSDRPAGGSLTIGIRPRIMVVAMSLLIGAIVLIDLAVPNVEQKRALLEGGVIAIWIFFFATTFLRRRQ